MHRAITFDVTQTLLHSPHLGEIYSEVLGRHGIAAPPAEVRRLVPLVWQELDCLARPGEDRFGAHPEGARGWWRRFVCRLVEHLGEPPPSRFATAELYHRFGEPTAWEVYPDVEPALAALSAMGLTLGVVSNWDERLGPLLSGIGLGRHFAVVVTSSEVGTEKPDPRIFRHALDRLGVEPALAIHVGDRRREDFEGALATGMTPLHLDRRAAPTGDGRHGGADLGSLEPLPRFVAELADLTPPRR